MSRSLVKLNVAGAVAEKAAEPATDHDLVRRCQDGDAAAFEGLVDRYQDRVYNLVYRMVGRHEDAQDIAQDVFLRALENIGSFRGQAQVFTWLFRIATNLAISRRRRGQRVRFVSLSGPVGGQDGEDHDARPMDPPDRSDNRPDESAERDELQRRVAAAIAGLDEEFRSVLVLKDIEGLDYQQIADILELPLGTIKSRLHRARSELKDALRPIVE